jgi:DNA processing protein
VSGLARGIDAAAHAGALEAGGLTVAVLPGSLDTITPPSHAPLARRIERHGALAAEWAHGMPAARGLFLRRNRLIAAVARATVVVEAAGRSGALSTAAVARRLGRPVLAVPGDIDRPSSRGCLALLRGGARVCEGAADVLASLDAPVPSPPSPAGTLEPGGSTGEPAASNDASRVAAALELEPCALDTLARRAGVAPARVLAALLQLEWAGVATAHPGPRWSRTRGAAG